MFAPSLGRVILGTALAGGALGTLPALAHADSFCTYNPAARTATVVDGSGLDHAATLRVSSGFIVVSDTPEAGSGRACAATIGFDFASVTNTDRIDVVRNQPAAGATPNDGVVIEEAGGVFGPGATRESDGNSEIEINVADAPGVVSHLAIDGTDRDDVIRVGGHGRVGLGADGDIDVTALAAGGLSVDGRGGNDFLSGRGFGSLAPFVGTVRFFGRLGADTVVDSPQAGDFISGGQDHDIMFSADGRADHVFGDSGFDEGTVDAIDQPGADLEQPTFSTVGRLHLAPRAVTARARQWSELTLTWTHPRSWRALRSIYVGLYRGLEQVGMINVRPRGELLKTSGAVEIMANASRVTHSRRTVKARLHLRVAKALAGQDLRIGVTATDRRGRTQVVPAAGSVRVTR